MNRNLDRQIYSLQKIAFHLGRLDMATLETTLAEFAKENPHAHEVIQWFREGQPQLPKKPKVPAKVKVLTPTKQLAK